MKHFTIHNCVNKYTFALSYIQVSSTIYEAWNRFSNYGKLDNYKVWLMFRRKTNWYFFCLLLFKVWWSLGSVLRTTPSLSCAKKILEHDFNTSVYTHSHGSLMFFVRPYCLKMTWVELGEEGRTIFVWCKTKCILVTQINWSFFPLQTLLL